MTGLFVQVGPQSVGYIADGNGCWIWTGGTTGHRAAYGTMKVRGKRVMAHRYLFEKARGPIPQGMEMDHLCRNPSCVNPSHLEAVTHKENMNRGNAPSAIAKRTGLCPKGHQLEGRNLFIRKNGKRTCMECKRATERAWEARHKS
jgi:hypothetical protein